MAWLTAICPQAGAQQVSVTPYYGGRRAALSLTFDDGLMDQYTLARTELNKRGLRATFAVIGSKVGGTMHSSQDRMMGISGTPCMTWDMLRQLVADGHEIGNHGWEHRNVTRLTDEELRHEVQHNDSVILQQTGQAPRTYFYPGNKRDSATTAFCEQKRVGSRTFQLSLGSKRTAAFLRNYVDTLIARGMWGVTMTHGIATGYDHFQDPQVLWQFLDYVSSRHDALWVAPHGEVNGYVKERDNTQLTMSQTANTLVVNAVCTLDAEIFTQPLTLRLSGLRAVSAMQGSRPISIYVQGECQMLDFFPHGGPIMIVLERQ
ncbi:MAG: polysaccharide deacetylase family protein [Prevotella sp.]|nr:polysaccharide deacetylase family protein [Prevotella sp.]